MRTTTRRAPRGAIALALAAFLAGSAIAAPAPSLGKPAKVSERLKVSLLYADGSALYVSPQEPGPGEGVTLKFRAGKDDLSAAFVRFGEGGPADGAIEMDRLVQEGPFDYWFAELPPSASATEYYFELRRESRTIYYSRRGVELKVPDGTVRFRVVPGFSVPAWMKGAVLYQIYVDRFNNGDPTNDVLTNEYMYDNWPSVRVQDWNALPDATTPYAKGGNRTREFFGGDLEGIIQKLGYLKDLGVDGIYLNPIFVSPSNHKYDTQDYAHVDPHFGVIVKDGGALVDPAKDPNYGKAGASDASVVNRDATKYRIRTTDPANLAASDAKLKELIDKAHALGIKVILDGVFNHSGSFNRWFDREGIYPADQGPGAYESKTSPYVGYYSFKSDAWPNNESYEAWSGFKTLPKLNFEGSKDLVDTILGLGARWVGKDIGADGWRLDVAADLGHSPKFNHRFWSLFRGSVKAANPGAVILAEVYGDSSSWLSGNEWDTVMNYDAFFEPVGWYLTGLEKHSYYSRPLLKGDSRTLANDLREKMARLPYNSLETAMNELDNHDHSRFLTRTSGFVDDKRSTSDVSPQDQAAVGVNKGLAKAGAVMQLTMPGAPTLYYGNEAGLPGFTDPDDRRTFPWGREDQELLSFYKDAIAVHKEFSSIKTGSFLFLSSGTQDFVAYGRWDSASRVLVAINSGSEAGAFEVPVGEMGLADGEELDIVLVADRDGHSTAGPRVKVKGNLVSLDLPPFTSLVLASRKGAPETKPAVASRPVVKSLALSGGSVKVGFSEPMVQRGMEAAFSISPAVKGKLAWNGSDLWFTPEAPLPKGEYRITIAASARAVRGGFSLGKEAGGTVVAK